MTMSEELLDENYRQAHKKAEEHLAACNEAMFDDDGNEAIDKESPAVGPYCGCETCMIREVLWAAKEELVAIARAESAGPPTMGLE